MSTYIDINCDMGESYGRWTLGHDEEVMPHITSANIACGFHAGDPAVMRKTVRAALDQGVAIGAHPGLPDLAGFGRREMAITPQDAADLMTYQIGALYGVVKSEGGRLRHVKPHGALYNMAAKSAGLADAIAGAVKRFDSGLVLFGLSGSELILAGRRLGIPTAAEAFADRTYQPDGSLTPRTRADALITDAERAADQAVRIVEEGRVRSVQGTDVAVQADTICIHGDGPHAVEFARRIRRRLEAAGVVLAPPTGAMEPGERGA
jgi:5-oxoprolinase (ATP-hydrolysing) subunit A